MERVIQIIISENGEMKMGEGQYTVGELIKIGHGIINLANGIKINCDGEKSE